MDTLFIHELDSSGNKTSNRLRFYSQAVKNQAATDRLGYEVFDTHLFVEVHSPGSTNSFPVHSCEVIYGEPGAQPAVRVTQQGGRFAREIKAYRDIAQQEAVTGHPLNVWPLIDVASVETLKSFRILTVEQLADLPDATRVKLGPLGTSLVEKAKTFLKATKDNSKTNAVAAENARLKEMVEEQARQISELQDAFKISQKPSDVI